jgi:hypothetical protein
MAKGLFPGYVAGVVMAKASLGVDLCMIRSPGNGTKPFWLSSITQLNQKSVSSVPRSTDVENAYLRDMAPAARRYEIQAAGEEALKQKLGDS